MKQLSTKKRLLLVMIPIAVLPLLFACIYSFNSLYQRILKQESNFYKDIINQTASNIDFYYNQYAINFVETAKSQQLKDVAEYSGSVTDMLPYNEALLQLVSPKFRGLFFLMELDKNDNISGEPYNLISLTNNNFDVRIQEFVGSPIFEYMKNKKDMNPIFCVSPAIYGMNANRRPQFYCPDLTESENKIPRIMLVIEGRDFCHSLYEKNTRLNLGTLYIRDLFGNIMNVNHPYKDDYYEYDYERKCYVLNPGDNPNDPDEEMSFAEYRMLNTDETILKTSSVIALSEKSKEEEECLSDIITFKGKRYLALNAFAEDSQAQITYFHPMKQILSPINKMMAFFLFLTTIIVIVAIFVCFYFSKYFTRPISDLVRALSRVERGDYDAELDHSHEFGEFIDVGKSFDSMQKTISTYHNKMEELVKERTEELSMMYEQFQQELIVAQKIQSLLIPNSQEFPFEISSMYVPLEKIGGDLYDIYQISENRYVALILDVCGHGIPAALITTMAKLSFRGCSERFSDPAEIVSKVNQEMANALSDSGNFFTAFYCIIDMKKKTLSYVNAGHNPMILLKKDGNVQKMESSNAVIGVMPDLTFNAEEIKFNDGDKISLFTDGITETRNCENELYGEERLLNIIRKYPDNTAEKIEQDLNDFRKDYPIKDDLTFVLLKLSK